MSRLFDQFGREITPRDLRRPDQREMAVAQVRDRWSTYPSNGLTPVKLAAILRQADDGDMLAQAELFEEMEEKDAHLASQLQIRKLAVQGLEWDLVVPSPSQGDVRIEKIVDFCREALNAIPNWEEAVLDMLDAIAKGYSLTEIVWDVSGGQVIPKALRWIHPKKVTFWESMTPRVLTEEEPIRGIDPPPWRVIYHRHKARSGYDTRAGVLRTCVWMYLFKNYAVKDWVAFSEVYGMPLRVGKYDQGASDADKQALLAAIRSLGSDAAGIISRATEIEFIESQKTSTLNIYESLTAFCDAQMSKAILGQTLTSEAGGSKGEGSYALGKVHADVRADILRADAKALSQTITQQLLRPMVGFNFGWEAPVPEYRLIVEDPEDMRTIVETYKVLAELGFDLSQEHIAERFKIPMRDRSETPLMWNAAGGDGNAGSGALRAKLTAAGRSAPMASSAAAVQAEPVSRDTADILTERLADHAADGEDALVEPIRRLLESVDSLEAFRDALIDVYPEIDPTRLGELIGQALALADLAGRADAVEGL